MMSFMVIQLIFIIGIIALFIFLVHLLKSKLINRKQNLWLMTSYLVILVTIFSISYLSPINTEKMAHHINIIDNEKIPNLYVIPELTGSIDMAEDYLIDEWSFEFGENKLAIDSLGENYLSNIAVETKSDDSNTIEVELYITPNVVDNVDMSTGNIPPTNISLAGEELTIEPPESVEVNVSQMQKEFSIRQFTDANYMDDETDLGTGTGVGSEVVEYTSENKYVEPEDDHLFSTELLYIKIPANVKVDTNDDLNMFFVDENQDK